MVCKEAVEFREQGNYTFTRSTTTLGEQTSLHMRICITRSLSIVGLHILTTNAFKNSVQKRAKRNMGLMECAKVSDVHSSFVESLFDVMVVFPNPTNH